MRATTKRPQASAVVLATMLVGVGVIAGCGGADRREAVARQREWASLVRTKHDLDAERRELARAREQLASAAVDPDGTPADVWAEALGADVAKRERRVGARSAALEDRLVRYVAGFGTLGTAPSSPALQAALHLKSDEDVDVAQEWIDRGGDYRRAIEILETQRHVDSDYPPLERALERARTMRYVTAERFSRLRPGMTRVEVRAALGPVNLRQVLRRPAERLEAWFYPKPGGGRAGVYFRFDPTRRAFVVYQSELETGGHRQSPAVTTG